MAIPGDAPSVTEKVAANACFPALLCAATCAYNVTEVFDRTALIRPGTLVYRKLPPN
jgi:hypothetical protein